MPGDPLCLGDVAMFNCTLQDTHLTWEYSGDGSTRTFLFSSTPGLPSHVGPFVVVLVSVPDNSTTYFESTATSMDGLNAAVNGKSISCSGSTEHDVEVISFSSMLCTS